MDDVVTQAPAARLIGMDRDVGHFQFGLTCHEGVQYNFFCDGKYFAARIIESRSLRHQSAWVYDNGVVELLNEAAHMERIGTDHLDIRTPRFHMASDDAQGSIAVLSESSSPELEIKFTTPVSSSWAAPGEGAGLHQPLIPCEVAYGGKTYSGIGYCKRYWFERDLEYWGWRFVEGEVGGAAAMLWTADATFGHSKYDYFKIATPDGHVVAADNMHTHHRDDRAFGTIDGTRYEVQIEEIAEWSTRLRTDNMDTKLRNRFCKMTVRHDGKEETGYAHNETGFGTVW